MRSREELDRSIEAYQLARQKALEEGNAWVAAESLHMVGLLYQQKNELEKAELELEKAQQEFEDMVAAVLRDRARVALEKEDLGSAENFINSRYAKV